MSNANSVFFTNSFSEEIWSSTYRFPETDQTIEDTWRRVAQNLASCEENSQYWSKQFYSILENFQFVPGGRILANAGTNWKTTYINCFVNPREIHDMDSLEGIVQVLKDQMLTLKSEGGWGCNFSFIRPRGAFIHGIGVQTPGAVKFMELFDKSSEIITQGAIVENSSQRHNKRNKGKIRKGAMMGILSCWHPDIIEFITSKQKEGRLSKFNISVGCHDDFMIKILEIDRLRKAGQPIPEELERWELVFPDTTHPAYKTEWYGDIYDWKNKGYPIVVYQTVKASELWHLIMLSTYNRNDPGVVFLDNANATHCWNYGKPARKSTILSTNPCGEQALPSAGCCNLGSLNLTQFVLEDGSDFDYDKIRRIVPIAVRFLDNVNTLSYAPLPEYRETMTKLRRIGLGIMGWGSALMMLRLPWNSNRSQEIQQRLMQTICHTAIEASIQLAKEKGAFEYCEKEKHAQHPYFQRIGVPQHLLEQMAQYGIRNSALFSIQPTGNTSILANIVSGGLEPVFMPQYVRTSICPSVPEEIAHDCPRFWEGEYKKTSLFKHQKEGTDDIWVAIGPKSGTIYKIDRNRGLTKEIICKDYAVWWLEKRNQWQPEAEWAKSALQLTVEDHVQSMARFAFWLDSAASKTINLPSDFPFDKFQDIYLECYKTGYIKGFTTYRAGTMTTVLAATSTCSSSTVEGEENNFVIKRPKTTNVEIHFLTVMNRRFIVVVGFLENNLQKPYEVFGGEIIDLQRFYKLFGIEHFPRSPLKGSMTKVNRKHYSLFVKLHENEKHVHIEDFNREFQPSEQVIFRLASTMLRHQVPVSFLVEQLQKGASDIYSLPAALARVLKKYIKDGQKVSGNECIECGSKLQYIEGCVVCTNCGWSQCS